MFHNKPLLIGIYDSSTLSQLGFWAFPEPISPKAITAFSVTTTSGTILINWGDDTFNTINSTALVNKTYSV